METRSREKRAREERLTILIANDGVTRAHNNTAALNDAVGLPRLHGSRALLGGSGVRENGEAVLAEDVRVTNRSVRHQPCAPTRMTRP